MHTIGTRETILAVGEGILGGGEGISGGGEAIRGDGEGIRGGGVGILGGRGWLVSICYSQSQISSHRAERLRKRTLSQVTSLANPISHSAQCGWAGDAR